MARKPEQQWPFIKKRTYPSGLTAWIVDARTKDGGERKTFSSKTDAETYAQMQRVKRNNEGASAFAMSPADRIDAEKALALVRPLGRTLREATEFFVRHLSVVKEAKTVRELVDELVENKRRDGASRAYLKGMRCQLHIFASSFPEMKVIELSASILDDWLRNLPHSPTTRNNYRRLLGVLFSYGVRRGYCLENPAPKTSRAKVVDKPPGILTPEQCARLLEAAGPEILPAIALGLFAGLRPEAEVWRLDWADVDLESGLIQIEAAKTKSARHRLVEMCGNIKLWLLPYRKSSGPVSPTGDKYNYLLQHARKSATEAAVKAGQPQQGITKWPSDALRHSFGTYHYARFQDPGKTMVQMGHTNPRTFHAHYRARVTPADAAKFWELKPQSALDQNILSIAAA
jgi:integrase